MIRHKKLKGQEHIGEVKVGTTKYPLYVADKIYDSGLKRFFNNGILGEINRDFKNKHNNYIAIKKNAKDKDYVLFHEIAHGIMYEMAKERHLRLVALKLLGSDEYFIDRLAKVLQKTFLIKNMKLKQKRELYKTTIYSMEQNKNERGLKAR